MWGKVSDLFFLKVFIVTPFLISLSFFLKLLIFSLISFSCKDSYLGNEILNVSITLSSSNVNIRASNTDISSKTNKLFSYVSLNLLTNWSIVESLGSDNEINNKERETNWKKIFLLP